MEPDDLERYIQKEVARNPEFAFVWERESLSMNLVYLRNRAELTQQEVAERMGVAQPRVAELEKRPWRVSAERLAAYARAVGGRLTVLPEAVAIREERTAYGRGSDEAGE